MNEQQIENKISKFIFNMGEYKGKWDIKIETVESRNRDRGFIEYITFNGESKTEVLEKAYIYLSDNNLLQ